MPITNIATRSGDKGKTSLWSGERVSKTDLRIQTVGAIDLALSALGKGHAYLRAGDDFARELSDDLIALQYRFTDLMGEICTSEEKKALYQEKRVAIADADVAKLEAIYEKLREQLDARGKTFENWKVYGERGEAAAEFYYIRACMRRAELMLWSLREAGFTLRDPLLKLVNRLSDVLFYIAVLLEQD